MSSMISALTKRPGEPPRHVNISNSLEALQKNVEGYIEVVTLVPYDEEKDLVGLAVICNEEGRLKGMPYNCRIWGNDYVGPVLLVGVKGEEFTDLPLPWSVMKAMFASLWEEDDRIC